VFLLILALLSLWAAPQAADAAEPQPLGGTMDDRRMTVGREQLARLNPRAEADLRAALDDIAPDMMTMVVAFGYGDIYARPGLAAEDRQVATIAALTALGNAEPQLRFHIDGALNLGLSRRSWWKSSTQPRCSRAFPPG
jgi:4-carboxymuconolactone decarboxylase